MEAQGRRQSALTIQQVSEAKLCAVMAKMQYRLSGIRSHLRLHFLAVSSRVSWSLTLLWPSFFIYKMGMVIAPTSLTVEIK